MQFKIFKWEAGQAQLLRAQSAPTEDLGLVFRTHMVAHDYM